jgi:rubrerythrin
MDKNKPLKPQKFDIVNEKEMAKQHLSLVDKLKNSLLMGQVGFLQAGKFLSEICSKETYKYEDSANEQSFADFCERPDIPIPGRTAESRRRTAYTLIKIYEQLLLKSNVSEKRLAPIGWTKLGVIATLLEKDDKQNVEDWLVKAETLKFRDLTEEVATKDKSLSQLLNCKHENISKFTAWKCDDCKTVWRTDPNK